MKKRLLLLVPVLLAGLTSSAAAQVAPPPAVPAAGQRVYTYVEQMPQLPGGGGAKSVIAAISQNFHYPPEALQQRVGGLIFVGFVVAETGQVGQVRIVKSLRADCDSAAVQAVRELPRFEPGRQQGKPVAVHFTVPIRLQPPAAPSGR